MVLVHNKLINDFKKKNSMKNYAFVLTLLFLSFGCKPTMDYVWKKDNFNGKKFNKIAVIAVSDDFSVRQEVENGIIRDLKENGIEAISGLSFLPPNAPKSEWEAENIAKKLKAMGVDGALSVNLINKRDRTDYVPGETYVYPTGYYRYGNHIYNNYSRIYNPGYYVEVEEYLIEANLYDVTVTSSKQQALMWTGQSKLYNPSGVKSAATSYSDNLIGYMLGNNILLK